MVRGNTTREYSHSNKEIVVFTIGIIVTNGQQEAVHHIYNQAREWSEEECKVWLSSNDPEFTYEDHYCEWMND